MGLRRHTIHCSETVGGMVTTLNALYAVWCETIVSDSNHVSGDNFLVITNLMGLNLLLFIIVDNYFEVQEEMDSGHTLHHLRAV